MIFLLLLFFEARKIFIQYFSIIKPPEHIIIVHVNLENDSD